MTTPASSGVMYASVDDLRQWVSGTDSGVGTPAQLTDDQLSLTLYSASNRVSIYAGAYFDGSSAGADPPGILHDLTLDLAAFFAWRIYLKGKVMASDHPVFIAYQSATKILDDVRANKITLEIATAGAGLGPGEGARVINRIPQVFTGDDSNTRIGMGGVLEDDVPAGLWTPRGMSWLDPALGGQIYQG